MISFKRFIISPWLGRRYVDADMPVWLLDFLAKPTVIRSPLLSHTVEEAGSTVVYGGRVPTCAIAS